MMLICASCNLRIHDVHIILLRQMASLFKARFLKVYINRCIKFSITMCARYFLSVFCVSFFFLYFFYQQFASVAGENARVLFVYFILCIRICVLFADIPTMPFSFQMLVFILSNIFFLLPFCFYYFLWYFLLRSFWLSLLFSS